MTYKTTHNLIKHILILNVVSFNLPRTTSGEARWMRLMSIAAAISKLVEGIRLLL